ncbi:hypothetical protein VPH35_063131 [Triticum aestivum]|uniref:uncharacterized protein n=1 Tax=Triticum aestivum TaxID=4565 RepID=UPI000843FD49|nr:uncharacterized protein LOC123075588 [Triticum aestivum]
MGSKYLLFGLCSLLVLSGQRTLFTPALARGIPGSSAATFASFVHAPTKNNDPGSGVHARQPAGVEEQKGETGLLNPRIWPRCPPSVCHWHGTSVPASTRAAANP